VQYVHDPELCTYNTAGTEKPGEPYENEVDDYRQTHYQLLWNTSVLTQIQTYVTLHYTRGKGYYEQYKSAAGHSGAFEDFLIQYNLEGGDAIRRRWLDNHFFGIIGGIHYFDPTEKYSLQIGGAWHRYLGDHFGEVIWSSVGSVEELPDYYHNDAEKSDKSGFIKVNYYFNHALSMIADVQFRGVKYSYQGLDSEGEPLQQEVKHTFLNPKLGISLKTGDRSHAYGFLGVAQREPNRDDYITSSLQSRPKPEKLYNAELGWEFSKEHFEFGINGYYMHYADQLVLTGRINDVGEYARQNIDRSYRAGIEATVTATQGQWDLLANATISRNRVSEFDEYVDDWQTGMQHVVSLENTHISFSPGFISYGEVGYDFLRNESQTLRIAMSTKLVHDQYLDNTGNASSKLSGYSLVDAQLSYGRGFKGGRIDIRLMLKNIRDEKVISNGWIYRFDSPDYDPRPDDPYADQEQGDTYHLKGLFPQAGRHVLGGVTVEF
jgi:iron complex outermembrane receptor protein